MIQPLYYTSVKAESKTCVRELPSQIIGSLLKPMVTSRKRRLVRTPIPSRQVILFFLSSDDIDQHLAHLNTHLGLYYPNMLSPSLVAIAVLFVSLLCAPSIKPKSRPRRLGSDPGLLNLRTWLARIHFLWSGRKLIEQNYHKVG